MKVSYSFFFCQTHSINMFERISPTFMKSQTTPYHQKDCLSRSRNRNLSSLAAVQTADYLIHELLIDNQMEFESRRKKKGSIPYFLCSSLSLILFMQAHYFPTLFYSPPHNKSKFLKNKLHTI